MAVAEAIRSPSRSTSGQVKSGSKAKQIVQYRRPWMAPYQLDAIFNQSRYAIIEATTKAGKTAGSIVWLVEQALTGRPGDNYWWVAPVNTQTDVAFKRTKRGLPASIYTSNETHKTITLLNGAMIWFKSGDNPDTLYGDDVRAAVIDEASRLKEDSWYAVRSTLTATRGALRVIGNVKGRKNWFYRMARRAEHGEQDMSHHRITALDAVKAGILDKEEIEDARRQLPDAVFRELYMAEPSDDGGNPFGLDAIRKCIKPMSNRPPKAWGWDLAKSVDWTVGIALDDRGDVCRFNRFQKPWLETLATIKQETGRVPALVDSTGVGDPIVESLQRDLGSNFEGFKYTSQSKQQLMEGLAVAIQRSQIHFPDGVIVSELENFEYEYTRSGVRYTAPEGFHDDCVSALGQVRKKLGAGADLSVWEKL